MSAGLPKVTININKNGLGKTPQTEDGIVGMILTGATVAGGSNITAGTPVSIFSLAEAEAIGITSDGTNAFAWKQIKLFYDIAGTGAELWLMVLASTVAYKDYADLTKVHAPALLNAAKGRIRTLAVSKASTGLETITAGLDAEVANVVLNAQLLAASFTTNFKPLRVVVDGKDFNGTQSDLADYTTGTDNRVAIFIGNSLAAKNADVGLVIGKIASLPVQRSIARVLDGSLPILNAYFTDGEPVEALETAWDAIHNKGYIFLRSFVGRSGYFFTDDPTCTLGTDDLNSLKRVAVIDKARLLAYQVFVDKIHAELPLEANGAISPALITSWKADVENAINVQMVANGEASGVKATIDATQDVLGTNELKMQLDVLPVGYASYITIDLGFATSL